MSNAERPPAASSDARLVVRHLLATVAYRASKVLRDAPPGFAQFTCGASTRRPLEIVGHLGDLMDWAGRMAKGTYEWRASSSGEWDAEVRRFFAGLAALDHELAAESFGGSVEKLVQGPVADALTHVGQLAMMRGMMGAPIRPESYARAEIVTGRVGAEQAPPRAEYDGDASTRG